MNRRRAVKLIALSFVTLLAASGGTIYWAFAAYLPQLDGQLKLDGLHAPVSVARDAAGVVTITASNQQDMARAMGFIHAQERFFQMDLLRRNSAGELGELFGKAALDHDRSLRLHRFRHRAERTVAAMPDDVRAVADAYTDGVNAGLAGHTPFEYRILRVSPAKWTAPDSILVALSLYDDLQDRGALAQRHLAIADESFGKDLADFLFARGTPNDAALDGSVMQLPSIPTGTPQNGSPPSDIKATPGSNNFAVAGALSKTGAAIVADDLHLGVGVPNVWFRARLVMPGKQDRTGITLPGLGDQILVGSNGHVAWTMTNSYIATSDAILLDEVPGDPRLYQTPDGPKKLEVTTEKLCFAHAGCQDIQVEETIWGPVVDRDPHGKRIAVRWVAHDENAVDQRGIDALQQATNVRDALAAAHLAGQPQQNLVVGDRDGHIGWTIIGQVPRRVGLNANIPASWAEGSRRWDGYLTPAEIPEIIDPADGRMWTANNRVVGGAALAILGDGHYADPDRARTIRDDLRARASFTERDLLAIQLDDHAQVLQPWADDLQRVLQQNGAEDRDMLAYVRNWGGRAAIDSVGYRLVRGYLLEVRALIFSGLNHTSAPLSDGTASFEGLRDASLRALVTQRPANLVPAPFKSWDALEQEAVKQLKGFIVQSGGLAKFTWGARNHAGIHHPLSPFIPGLAGITDPPDEPLPGDSIVPRVQGPGVGASERIVVSPGHEETGIYEMPVGQAGNPLSPYYLAGHRDWVEGRPTPFLPGPAKWHLSLVP